MEYELLRGRGLQPSENLSSMQLLYYYGKYKKERETAASQPNSGVTKMY